ncbi:manganese ABC transporter periplasmic-binding protein SitA [Fusibacter sp. 3D3]|nr:manganese ABC transporter periplasmic-binding protein SitA [Fusibacter sp. 3D3]
MKKNVRFIAIIMVFVSFAMVISGCSSKEVVKTKHTVVATTTMLADLARVIGGDAIEVQALMGPGIDPHLYNASAGDVDKMSKADLLVYSGLHLEGKMGDIFENLKGSNKIIIEIAEGLDESKLITDQMSGAHDPHIWFDVLLWKLAAENLYNGFIELDPENEAIYTSNFEAYKKELDALDTYIKEQVELVPESARILITAHDAFNYFGKAYGFDVMGLQGISTQSEAGTADVTELANFIVKHKIKALFVESSVPKKNIEALQEAVAAQGFDVAIGGELYSDSLGSAGTPAGTYIGTVKANIDTIVNALK